MVDTSVAYRPRIVDAEFDRLLTALPAIAFQGAKAVGKTRTAKQRAATVWELDNEAHLAIAHAEPKQLLTGTTPVLIDEWQHVPPLWNVVRRAVDDGAGAGSYVLTGSAVPKSSGLHSGAGRIVTLRMRPLSLVERGIAQATVSLADLLTGERGPITGKCASDLAQYVNEIVASGFPGLRAYSGAALRAQLDSYIGHIIDREFPELGHKVRKPDALRRWMAAYAAATATTTKWEKIRAAATPGHGVAPTRAAAHPYRDILERLWILDPVPAWLPTRSYLKRMAQPPKHHLVDPALAARLVGIDADALLAGEDAGPKIPRDGTFLGALFDSLVTQSVRVYAQHSGTDVKHMRTGQGEHEIDLIVERPNGKVVAIEVKLTQVPTETDVRHLLWLRDQIGADLLDAVVVTTGTHAFRRPDGIAVVPAALLGP